MDRKVCKGFIIEKDCGDEMDVIFLDDYSDPLVYYLQGIIDGKLVTVRYWISEERKEKEDLIKGFLDNLYGNAKVEYYNRYSEITGYLWTEENLIIGGHDLISEIRSYIGKYIYLEIDIHE